MRWLGHVARDSNLCKLFVFVGLFQISINLIWYNQKCNSHIWSTGTRKYNKTKKTWSKNFNAVSSRNAIILMVWVPHLTETTFLLKRCNLEKLILSSGKDVCIFCMRNELWCGCIDVYSICWLSMETLHAVWASFSRLLGIYDIS